MGRLLLLLLLLGAGVAQAAPRKLAVLELRNRAEITAQEADYLTDVVRGVAAGLPAGDWFVMTRENILAVLPPGTDLAKCLEDATCDVEVGRALGADVAARVRQSDRRWMSDATRARWTHTGHHGASSGNFAPPSHRQTPLRQGGRNHEDPGA